MIEHLLPAGVRGAEMFVDPADPAAETELYEIERDQITQAVAKRRSEYAGARACARAAMAKLGIDPAPLPKGPDGGPQWPGGVVGSLTHTEGYRAAAVAFSLGVRSVGVDAERHGPLPPGVLRTVALPSERDWLAAVGAGDDPRGRDRPAGLDGVHWDRLLFSAKETTYKAWHPLTGRWLGFEDAHITVTPGPAVGATPAGEFVSRLLVPGHTRTGTALTEIRGRWIVDRGFVVTAAVVM